MNQRDFFFLQQNDTQQRDKMLESNYIEFYCQCNERALNIWAKEHKSENVPWTRNNGILKIADPQENILKIRLKRVTNTFSDTLNFSGGGVHQNRKKFYTINERKQ